MIPLSIKNLGSTLLHTTNDAQTFFSDHFSFGFQYLIIIYINFKFYLNIINIISMVGRRKE
jgi:hypothetical protein